MLHDSFLVDYWHQEWPYITWATGCDEVKVYRCGGAVDV